MQCSQLVLKCTNQCIPSSTQACNGQTVIKLRKHLNEEVEIVSVNGGAY